MWQNAKKNEKVVNALDVLNSYRKELLDECKDDEVTTAKAELDKARERYNKLATSYVLSNSLYCDLQTECVRTAVRTYSVTHNIKRFLNGLKITEKTYKRPLLTQHKNLVASCPSCTSRSQAVQRSHARKKQVFQVLRNR